MQKQKLIVILGPTASGKSGLAVELAKRMGGEVVSADSRQIYRGLDIGTEKITKREMRGVPHHCIDIASPRHSYSVEQWRRCARKAIDRIYLRSTPSPYQGESARVAGGWGGVATGIPIVTGGTGLYIDALIYGIEFPPVKPDLALRHDLEKQPVEELYARLRALDPVRARTIEQQNPRRLIRAIEVATALGHVPTLTRKQPLYDVVWIGLRPPFSELETRIATRIDQALRKGLVTETKRLREEIGLSWKRINELGMEYRVCAECLRGELPKSELRDTLVREVRRYAKRQLTWLARYKDVRWYATPAAALAAKKDS